MTDKRSCRACSSSPTYRFVPEQASAPHYLVDTLPAFTQMAGLTPPSQSFVLLP